MSVRRAAVVLLCAVLAGAFGAPSAQAEPKPRGDEGLPALHSLQAPVTDESFYFVMADRFENGSTANDTGGLTGDRLVTGFDPTSRGFYNGGDLKGLLEQIDYIRGLGTTSIWLTPSFKNKAVQREDGPSAGYHGYWITDFTQIDPHLGTNAELRALVDAAHARGMKVYFDIITNHTADVIGYQEGARLPYVSKDVDPYLTAAGVPFDDRDYAGSDTFPPLSPTVSFPYTPVVDPAEENLKVPAWLNDLTLYHNRGDTTLVGENSWYGDFFGLDDVFTENPRVVNGMIDIYKTWIADFGVDGFRIDTMKHVNDELWQKFGAEERKFASQGQPASQLESFFAGDDWYTDADSNVYQLPTFLGNHDMGRIGFFVQTDNPGAGDTEWMARDRLAHELMYFSRGNPVIYYGDEQGFTGSGGDQFARQTLFASQVPDYLDDDLLGTIATHAQDNFVSSHPLYQTIRQLAELTGDHPALRNGTHQHRYAEQSGAGIYAFTRIDRGEQREYVVALNNSEAPKTAAIPTYVGKRTFELVYGDGPAEVKSGTDRKLTLTVPPLSAGVFQLAGGISHFQGAPPHFPGPPP